VSSVKRERELEAVDIRPMNELDVPMVGAIERAGYQFPWSEGIFRDCLRVGYVCRVVEMSGDMAGYGIMSVGAGEAHVLNVCVREEYRCRGLARKMLLYLLDRARTAGMYEAFLEVRPSNTPAARLYRSLGFEQVGIRRGYYQAAVGREDAQVLRRLLHSDAKPNDGK
jgi:ribosomal-protein-alanine N-acetyltransferase